MNTNTFISFDTWIKTLELQLGWTPNDNINPYELWYDNGLTVEQVVDYLNQPIVM